MKSSKIALVSFAVVYTLLSFPLHFAGADPSKYPQFAQQKLPDNITPQFVSADDLFADLKAGKKPVIIDVRSAEEFREAHITEAVSAPLGEFTFHLKSIPKDRPLVLY